VIVTVSAAHGNDRSVLPRHYVIPIDLAPFMSLWRTAKVALPVIDPIAPVPVVLLNPGARPPFLVLPVSVVVAMILVPMILVLMILGHGGHACQCHSQDG
jgi:hypothetical protein